MQPEPLAILPAGRRWCLPGWILGVLVSLAALALALVGVDMTQVLAALERVQIGWLALAVLASFATLVTKAARWMALLERPAAPVKPGEVFGNALASQSVGIFMNMFLPARLGDLARVVLYCARSGGSRSQALGTVVVEKVFDILLLLAGLGIFLPGGVFPAWFADPLIGMALLGTGLLLGMLVFALQPGWWGERLFRLSHKMGWGWFNWLGERIGRGLSSLNVFRDARRLAIVLSWSVAIWYLGVLTNLFVFWSLGAPLGLEPAVFLLTVLQVGVAVPSSPGRVGVFHYLTVLSLGVFGFGREESLAIGVLLHLLVMLPIALLGGLAWRSFSPSEWRAVRPGMASKKNVEGRADGEMMEIGENSG